jgi:hypothetical protein
VLTHGSVAFTWELLKSTRSAFGGGSDLPRSTLKKVAEDMHAIRRELERTAELELEEWRSGFPNRYNRNMMKWEKVI